MILLIVDTRGRLEIQFSLIQEIRSIKDILLPLKTILVVDSMTEQISANIDKEFNENVEITGAIFTKFDLYDDGVGVLYFLLKVFVEFLLNLLLLVRELKI